MLSLVAWMGILNATSPSTLPRLLAVIHVIPSLYVTAAGRETDAPSPDRMTERVYEPLAFAGAWTRSWVLLTYEVADALVPPTRTIDPGAKFVPVTRKYPPTLERSAVSSMGVHASSVIWTPVRVMGWEIPVNCDPSPLSTPVTSRLPVTMTFPVVSTRSRSVLLTVTVHASFSLKVFNRDARARPISSGLVMLVIAQIKVIKITVQKCGKYK